MTLLILDRAATERAVPEALEAALIDPNSQLVVQWRGRVLVRDSLAVLVAARPELIEHAAEVVWLGRLAHEQETRHCFVVDVSALDQPKESLGLPGTFADLRLLGDLPADHFGLLAYARGMLAWHNSHPYCPRCGAPTRPKKAGHTRVCEAEHEHFPRTDPAVMILIKHTHPSSGVERCLIARQPAFPPGMYSALAGFVEPGESLEDAVAREALEEAGLHVTRPRYFRSQTWPFPASLMLAFVVDAESDQFHLADAELEAARWVTRAELLNPDGFFTPPGSSLAHHMLKAFAQGEL